MVVRRRPGIAQEREMTALTAYALAALTDEQVVTRVLEGETALFEVLMRRNNGRLYRAVRSVLRDEQDVEDVMQQAYVNAYSHLEQFGGRARFSTWLTRIAVHEALGRARKQGARMETVIDEGGEGREDRHAALASGEPSPEHQAFSEEMRVLLEGAIDALPAGYRDVFMLRDVEGMSTSEVGEALSLSDEAVKTRLHRARGLIRDRLFAATGAAAPHAFRFHAVRCDRVVASALQRIAGADQCSTMPNVARENSNELPPRGAGPTYGISADELKRR